MWTAYLDMLRIARSRKLYLLSQHLLGDPVMSAELGMVFAIECVGRGIHGLESLDARPMTRAEADLYCRAHMTATGFRNKPPKPEPLFWIPLSAIQCVYLKGKPADREYVLTPEDLAAGFHEEEEVLADDE